MSEGRVHSIDSFGTVDGPGIRYVVFMQGCLMRCRYCHNRDTWDLRHGGKLMDHKQVTADLLKVRPYISGGITVTGGEPLLQPAFVADLFAECHQHGIHTCLDSNGFAKKITPDIERLLDHTDLVLLDIKHMDEALHRKLTLVTSQHTKHFAEILSERKIPTWIRYVVVEGYTVDPHYASMLAEFIQPMKNIEKVELLPYHGLGAHKWQVLHDNYELKNIKAPTKEQLIAIQAEFSKKSLTASY
ncbi:Pyruvate formate-lyase 1-activating enzyme [invertebrate metagenome]|uniref:Pyruvate formate-lyase 1-activating enzyme n=1 Tax=invertebrate metagenome TaxID=1711999 RepID=A0A2H9T4B1_9ZZZZ